ncbi:MAG TPA: hypothetical protein VIF62_03615 [Labilithrix sp.]|jgi:hypothetical protein
MKLALAIFAAFAAATVACSGAPPSDGGADYEVVQGSKPPSGGSDAPPSDDPTQATDTPPADPPPSSSSSSSSSSSGSTPPPPAAKPTSVTLTIDGETFAFGSATVWANVSAAGTYNVFLKVTGPGAPDGTDFDISATATGTGCVNTANYITYRPVGDTQYMPKSANEPTCGLSITSLPKNVGDRFTGSFKATLYGINVTPAKTKSIDLTFDVLRDK